jgi:hypothetical protein
MKDGLENSFKNSLNDFELPYDAQAWESLSQKLGAKRWYQTSQVKWSAALIVAVGISSFLIVTGTKTKVQQETQTKSIQKETKSPTTPSKTEQQISKYTKEETELPTVTIVDLKTECPYIIDAAPPVIPHSIPLILNQMDVLGFTDQAIETPESTPTYNRSLVEIDFKNRCQGETLQLEENKNYVRFISYAGKKIHYSYNEAISLKLTEPGKVVLMANSGPYGQFEEFGSFDVNATPTLNINSDRALNYEDGLPKMSIQAESSEGQVTWHSTNILNANTGKNVELLAFNKGYAIVEAQATASNGCTAKEKEMIQIPTDYNLLAVNAFNPQSQDSRNSTFMPYALTIRQTPFKLIVLDPDNGGLVFQSSDASNAWDGIDRRDGKLVPTNKAYIWKVVIERPVEGENGEYRGTIVRM